MNKNNNKENFREGLTDTPVVNYEKSGFIGV